VRVANRSFSTSSDQPAIRALGWSIAVVLSGGLVAALTTPSAAGQTVLQQGLGAATDAAGAPPAAAPGPAPAAPGSAAATAAGPSPSAPAATATPTTAKAKAAPKAKAGKKATAAPATTATAPAPAPAAAPRLQPDAGSYPLRISGTSAVDGKSSSVPSTGSLVVSGSGGDQTLRTVGVPGDLVLVQRASAGGVDLVSFSLSAAGKTLTFRPSAPVAFVRTQPGASWSWSTKSTDGSVTLNQTASVTGAGSTAVGGTQVPTVTVQRTFSVSGAFSGTVRLTSTVSQVDRLPIVQHQVIDVKATVLGLLSTRVTSDATATVTSTRPQ
jgi:hypothetical protein